MSKNETPGTGDTCYDVMYYARYGLPLTLSDPMLDLVQHYDFPVPDTFLDL
jgi:hypothetical protein